MISRPFFVVVLLVCSLSDLWSIDTPLHGHCGSFTSGMQAHQQRLSMHLQGNIPRPVLPLSASSRSGFFLVHYADSGPDAVPKIDSDGNGIPDFVDATCRALDSAYRNEVNEQGYLPPPRDGMRGGTDQFDVYVRDMSAVDEGMYGRTVPDTLISASGQPERYLSFIEMDNNFDSTDRTPSGQPIFSTYGTDAALVTCAHEFHHAIQLGSYALSKVQPMLYELTSTWMEYRVYPSLHDNEQYLSVLLALPEAYPFGDARASTGYHWWWFGNVLQQQGGDALMRNVWERIATGSRPFAALVDACDAHGRAFADLFCTNMSALYQTGQRATSTTVIPRAALLPSISFRVDEGAIPPATTTGGTLRAFEVRAFRYTVPSATNDKPVVVGAVIANPDVRTMVESEPTTQPYVLRLASTNSGNAMPIPGSTWSISVSPLTNCMYVDGLQTSPPVGPYPQPFLTGTDDAVYLPVPNATQGDPAMVRVYRTDLVGIAEISTTVIIDGARIAVAWHPNGVRPGIYIVEVECAQQQQSFKVVIK